MHLPLFDDLVSSKPSLRHLVKSEHMLRIVTLEHGSVTSGVNGPAELGFELMRHRHDGHGVDPVLPGRKAEPGEPDGSRLPTAPFSRRGGSARRKTRGHLRHRGRTPDQTPRHLLSPETVVIRGGARW